MRPPAVRRPVATEPIASRGSEAELRALLDALPSELAVHVFTHASWTTRRADSYERLAFLGDSVLSLAITSHLYPMLEAERFGAGAADEDPGADGFGPLLPGGRRAAGRARPARGGRACRGGGEHAEPGLDRARAGLDDRGGDRRLLSDVRIRANGEGGGGGVRRRSWPRRSSTRSTSSRRCRSGSPAAEHWSAMRSCPRTDRRTTAPSRSSAQIGEEEIGRGSGRSKKDAEQAAAEEALESMRG